MNDKEKVALIIINTLIVGVYLGADYERRGWVYKFLHGQQPAFNPVTNSYDNNCDNVDDKNVVVY